VFLGGGIVNRSKWPLVAGVAVVGALAGVALGGRPTTLPTVTIPVGTPAPDTTVADTTPPDTGA
jgi:hypothetical protein